jgi:penicillin amidase
MDDARTAAAMIEAPGVNLMYGDKDGHIAWWAAAKLVKRREGIMSKRFLDGSTGNDDPLGFFSFDENPKSEDPASGFVYSANNQPDSCAVGWYPGYYVPEDRAVKISTSISARTDWDVESCKQLIVNSSNPVYPKTAKHLLKLLKTLYSDALFTEAANRLSSWEGEHGLESVGPVIYYRWIFNILSLGLRDEMGDELFKSYMNSHLMKTSYPVLLYSFESKWWDNLSTREIENRNTIVTSAWKQTIEDLSRQLGKEVSGWRWKDVHTLEHKHPVGRQKPFDQFLNVGPEALPGGNEVINNLGFAIDSSGEYKVTFGPAMRRIIDFANPEVSFSVLPTGQSGYFMAPHYSDQFNTFNSNTFRNQLMKKEEIVRQAGKPLILQPSK